MLYFSYKHDDPRIGGDRDYITYYYSMYLSPLDLTAARPPAIYRQLSAIATHLVYATGIFYPNDISFHPDGYDQRVFFAALFTNYICLVITAWLAGTIVQQELKARAFIPATLAGLICLLSFHTQVSVITGLTEGPSWLLFASAFLFYLRRQSLPIVIVFVLAIFQREVILTLFAGIAGLAALTRSDERRFEGFVLAASVVCFIIYFLMRKMIVLPFSEVRAHMDPWAWLRNLRNFQLSWGLVFQGFLSQNLLWIYTVSAALAARRQREWPFWLPVLLGSFLILAGIDILTAEGNNLGRYGSMLSPVLAALITVTWIRMERSSPHA